MTSEGQAWALAQIKDICEASSGLLELIKIDEPADADHPLRTTLSIDCRSYSRTPNGLPLRSRERLAVIIPAEFPLARAEVEFTHTRYAGFPHVQWGRHICLYQAPDTEWQPSDGMFGFFQRVDEWLCAAAADELDPAGLPLHPPVAYTGGPAFIIIPTIKLRLTIHARPMVRRTSFQRRCPGAELLG